MSGKRDRYVMVEPGRCAGPFFPDEMLQFIKLVTNGEALNDYERWQVSGSPLRFEDWLAMRKSLGDKVISAEKADRLQLRVLELITAVARHRQRKRAKKEPDDIDLELYSLVPELRD